MPHYKSQVAAAVLVHLIATTMPLARHVRRYQRAVLELFGIATQKKFGFAIVATPGTTHVQVAMHTLAFNVVTNAFVKHLSRITANCAVRVEHTRVLVNMIAGITPIVRSVHFQWKHNSLSASVLTELFFIFVPNAPPGTVRVLVVSIIP